MREQAHQSYFRHLVLPAALKFSLCAFTQFLCVFGVLLLCYGHLIWGLCLPANHSFSPGYWLFLADYPLKTGTITRCAHLAGRLVTRHAIAGSPALSVQWLEDKRQHFLATQNITAGQGSTLLLPPPQPELTIGFISTFCKFGPAACFQTNHTRAVHKVSRPVTFTTRYLRFTVGLFGLSWVCSMRGGGGFRSASDRTCLDMWPTRALTLLILVASTDQTYCSMAGWPWEFLSPRSKQLSGPGSMLIQRWTLSTGGHDRM